MNPVEIVTTQHNAHIESHAPHLGLGDPGVPVPRRSRRRRHGAFGRPGDPPRQAARIRRGAVDAVRGHRALVSGHGRAVSRSGAQEPRLPLLHGVPAHLANELGLLDPDRRLPGAPAPGPRGSERSAARVARAEARLRQAPAILGLRAGGSHPARHRVGVGGARSGSGRLHGPLARHHGGAFAVEHGASCAAVS